MASVNFENVRGVTDENVLNGFIGWQEKRATKKQDEMHGATS